MLYCMLYAICYMLYCTMLYCTCNASIENHASPPSGPHVCQHPASLRQDLLTCCNSVPGAKKKVRKSELTPEFHSDLMKWCIASTVVLFTAVSAILKIAVLPLKSVATKTEVTEVTVATKTEVTFPVLFPRITGLNQNTQLSGFLHPSPPTPRRRVQTLICIVPCLSFSLV